MLSLTIIVNVCHPGSDLLRMLLAAFRLLPSLSGSMYLCDGLSAHVFSPVLLSASAIYSGSSAPVWTAKEVRSSGLYLSEPRLSTSILIAPWDRLALCGCIDKTAVRQEKSKGLQLAFVPCSRVTADPNWEAVFKPFAPKNQVAVLINQDQFTELSCIFCAGHDQEMCFHLLPTFSYRRGHFNSSVSLSVTWTSCYHLGIVQPPGAELKQHLFSLERK